MTTPPQRIRKPSGRVPTLRWLAVGGSVLALVGCGSVLGDLVRAVIPGAADESGQLEGAPILDEPETGPSRSVYVVGPVLGWEHWGFTGRPYRLPPVLFEPDLFAGACPGLHLVLDDGPVGGLSVVLTGPAGWIEIPSSSAVDPHYARFGQVSPGDEPHPLLEGVSYRMSAGPGGACTSVGASLLALGRSPRAHVLR